ncbi:MAG: alpha-amylase family glycosyl hydrolase [Paludibacteraceae bacterium]|nr:alpha-amylase family glycosyl hydrolase [Paludibacteraceae bacterium]
MKKIVLFSLLLCYALSSWAANSSFLSRTDFRDESIYFVMTTRFYNGDPSNDVQCWDAQNYNVGDPAWRGDFKGLIEKMDYIKALGFTAIWITPIVENASGYDYHGYHAHDFSKVDKRYESEDVKFQDLIDAAHARGMKVILDIVLNHTGNFGEANLCKLFTRDWTKDQSMIDECMVPFTKKDGGKLPDNYLSLPGGEQYSARLSQMKNTTGVNYDVHNYWHHVGNEWNWDDYSRWYGQIAGDCVDLNTENPAVYNYLIECYGKFIAMGVDGFRIDTGGHISRLTFNKAFIPQFEALAEQYKAKRNGGDFFMYAEVCARERNVVYRNHENCSPFYYTWKESKNYAWDNSETSWDNIVVMEGGKGNHTNILSVDQQGKDDMDDQSLPNSNNAFLNGNAYHTPDYSKNSQLSVIDFPMHWNFRSASEAFAVKYGDKYYNDATWNVVYVDSHDYAPDGAPEGTRFNQDQSTWAENLALMFTFRGIPCVYYGSEIEFKKGCVIDKGPNEALINTGRAYFGGYIKGDINVTDFAQYNGATGNIAQTLSHPLSKHIQRLNRIRQAVPALRKGQYSTDGCNGSFAFKRRYTDANTDSYALVCISGGATFSNVLNGKYTDCVTGEVINVTNGTLKANCSGKGNLRVFVLDTDKTKAPGKVGEDGKYIYKSSSVAGSTPKWDGTEEELDKRFGQGGSTDWGEPVEPCVASAEERVVFFQADKDFGTNVAVHIWLKGTSNNLTGSWPGKRAEHLGGGTFKYTIPADFPADDSNWMIIWNNNNGGKQTADLTFTMRGLYTMSGYKSLVTKICEGGDTGETPDTPKPEDPETPILDGTMCLTSTAERAVFFTKPSSWGSNINCYVWYNSNTEVLGKWPGTAATDLGNGNYKIVMPESAPAIDNTWKIIWNDGNNQTDDLPFALHGLWTGNDRSSIKQTGTITEICKNDTTAIETPSEETTQGDGWFYDILGRRYAYPTHPGIYIRNGQKILVH